VVYIRPPVGFKRLTNMGQLAKLNTQNEDFSVALRPVFLTKKRRVK
jgi:hypothetical protein